MEIRTLRYFTKIVDTGSISKAAQELGITQPTLSRQMQELEEDLGKVLMIRGKRRITLTHDGIILNHRARQILSLVSKTEQDLSAIDEELSGTLTIEGIESAHLSPLFAAMNKMHETHPLVNFVMKNKTNEEALADLINGQADIALIDHNVGNNYNDLCFKKSDIYGLLLNKNDPLAKKEALTISDLNPLNVFVPFDFPEAKLSLQIMGRYNDLTQMKDFALNGYVLAKRDLIQTDFYSPLVFKPIVPHIEAEIHCITKIEHDSRLIDTYIRFVKREMRSK
jgi:DNA-binding transcriptional LysR family regulator